MTDPEAPLHLLLVDDDAVDRQAVRRALAAVELAVEVHEAPNATTAIGAVRSSGFDCILLDFLLPDRDGIHLLRQLRAEGILTPVVMLTGQGDERVAVELMKAGASDYIPKGDMSGPGLAQSIRHAVRVFRLEASARRAAAAHAQQLRSLAEAAVELGAGLPPEELVRRTEERARAVLLADVAEARLAVDPLDPTRVVAPDLVRLASGLGPVVRARAGEMRPEWRQALSAAGLTLPARSWLAAPLVGVDGTAIGLLHACDKLQRDFDEEDASMMLQLAQMSGQALRAGTLLAAAKRAAQARDDVVAVVSHDLRNPLNTITMGLAMVEREVSTSSALATLARMQRATHRLERIVSDLLDISRLDAGTLALDRRPVEVRPLVDELVDLLGAQATAKQVLLDVDVAPHLPPLVADRDRLLQVLMNLVGNAIKFTPEGGVVAIAARRAGEALWLEVRDTGPGIAAEDLPRVFDRFWQASRAGRSGAGLGLAIARGLTEAHGGTLTVESTVGLGTCMRVAIPLDDVARDSSAGVRGEGAPPAAAAAVRAGSSREKAVAS